MLITHVVIAHHQAKKIPLLRLQLLCAVRELQCYQETMYQDRVSAAVKHV
jgi:hypothetical protein